MTEYRSLRPLGFPNYSATSDGHIVNSTTGRELTERCKKGYRLVTLKCSGKSVPCLVHRLILQAFHGAPPQDGEKYTCDHIDRCRHNNEPRNLRWATPTQQAANSEHVLNPGVPRPASYRSVILSNRHSVTQYANMMQAAIAVKRDGENVATVFRKLYTHVKSGKPYNGFNIWYASNTQIGETWEPIPPDMIGGAIGYFVSNAGNVRTPSGRITAGCTGTSREYPCVSIRKVEYRVHRLVAAVLIPRIAGKHVVNHINGDKSDNRLCNLEWVDAKDNIRHAIDTGLTPPPRSTRICQMSVDDAQIVAHHESIAAAARKVQGTPSNIVACCRGRQKTAYGYKWCYV